MIWWCCRGFCDLISYFGSPRLNFRGGLKIFPIPKPLKMAKSYLSLLFVLAKWCVRCGGLCDSAFPHPPFLYILLCYGRKAISNFSVVWADCVLRMVGWILLKPISWMAFGSMMLPLNPPDFSWCWCVFPSDVWLIPRPVWLNLNLRYTTAAIMKSMFLINFQCNLAIYKLNAWHSMQLTNSQSLDNTSEHLFSVVVKTTSAEAKNSSLLGDVNAPHVCGKPNKQKNKKQAKQNLKVKSWSEDWNSFGWACLLCGCLELNIIIDLSNLYSSKVIVIAKWLVVLAVSLSPFFGLKEERFVPAFFRRLLCYTVYFKLCVALETLNGYYFRSQANDSTVKNVWTLSTTISNLILWITLNDEMVNKVNLLLAFAACTCVVSCCQEGELWLFSSLVSISLLIAKTHKCDLWACAQPPNRAR